MTTYAVLGAGRQGTAAAYDMARWGGAHRILMADRDGEVARSAADRVNRMVGAAVAEPAQVDVTDLEAVEHLLRGVDAALSAVPYIYNLGITRAAIRARCSLCDLGGNTAIVRQQHAFHEEALAAGVSIIPDCGQVSLSPKSPSPGIRTRSSSAFGLWGRRTAGTPRQSWN
jgi:lysine 6-dehydrogenase